MVIDVYMRVTMRKYIYIDIKFCLGAYRKIEILNLKS